MSVINLKQSENKSEWYVCVNPENDSKFHANLGINENFSKQEVFISIGTDYKRIYNNFAQQKLSESMMLYLHRNLFEYNC